MNAKMNLLAAALGVGAFVAAISAAETVTYSYDAAGRLTNAAYGGGATIAYAYDAAGNLLLREVTAGGPTYTLVYLAGAGGRIVGVATQVVAAGQSGTEVQAVGDDESVAFGAWSDGSAANPRTDTNVADDLTIVAGFESEGGAALDWYAARGFTPAGGEQWSDLDSRIVAGKGTTLLREFIADTDPANPADLFRVLAVSNGPPLMVQFQPGSTGRVYTLQYTDDLEDGDSWTTVPGTEPRPGSGGVDAMGDAQPPPVNRTYRIQVEVP
jgi:YD repeat-containing protein